MKRLGSIVICVLCVTPVSAWAQPFVSAGLSSVWLSEGRNDAPYRAGTLGGTSVAVQADGGWVLGHIGIAGESLLGATTDGPQSTRVARGQTQHRDYLFSGLLHVIPGRSARVSFEPVAGLTYGLGHYRFTGEVGLDSLGRPVAPLVDRSEWRHYVGPTVGMDFWTALTNRVELGVTARFSWLAHRSTDDDGVQTGLGSRVISVGGSLRVKGHSRTGHGSLTARR